MEHVQDYTIDELLRRGWIVLGQAGLDRLQSVETAINGLHAEINLRFDEINLRFDEINRRLDEINSPSRCSLGGILGSS
jgi:hypothetical protein